MAAAAGTNSTNVPCPCWYRVCLNTIVRKGVALDSERMRILPMGSRVHVIKVQERRVQIDQPIQGWCSLRSSNGDTILTPLDNNTSPETPMGHQVPLDERAKRANKQAQKEEAQAAALKVSQDAILSNNPQLRTLMGQMEVLRGELSNQQEIAQERDELKRNVEEQNAQLADLKGQISQIAQQEGLDDPLELSSRIHELKRMQQTHAREAEDWRNLAAAANEELQQMKAHVSQMMLNPNQVQQYRTGDVVMLKGGVGIVIVRYFGEVSGQSGLFIGVEFDGPRGDTSGFHDGVQYFSVPENCGMFFPVTDIKKIIPAEALLKQLNNQIAQNAVLKSTLANQEE